MVLDNLGEGVLVPDIYDPAINPLFRDVLAHYGVVALPCRIQDPDRKGKVESGIGHTQKTPLKGMHFESLEEAQAYLDRWERRWADTRIHGTTKRQVAAMFSEEKVNQLPAFWNPSATTSMENASCICQRLAAYGVLRDERGACCWRGRRPPSPCGVAGSCPGAACSTARSRGSRCGGRSRRSPAWPSRVGSLLDVLSDVRTIPDGTNLHTVRLIFRVDSWEGTLRPEVDGTTDAVAWFTPTSCAGLPLARYVQTVVERCDPGQRGRAGTTSSSSGAASAASSPPGRSSGHPCG